jgi:cytochrome P450
VFQRSGRAVFTKKCGKDRIRVPLIRREPAIENALAPPGPKDWIPGWSFLQLYRDPLAQLLRTARAFPDIAHVRMGRHDHYLIGHLDYIRDILLAPEEQLLRSFPPALRRLMGQGLLTSQGEFHRSQRRSIQPLFHHQQVAALAGNMARHIRRVSETWRHGETREICADMSDLACAVIVEALFGADAKSARGFHEIARIAIQLTGRKGYLVDALLKHLPLFGAPLRKRRHAKGLLLLDDLMYSLIAARRAGAPAVRSDLLSMLMDLRNVEDGSPAHSDRQLRDEAITLLFAGHETVATALSWTWYLLSQHPDAERRLHDEIRQVLGGRLPTMEDVPRLPYASAVLSEAMRLYPPGWIIVRRSVQEWRLGEYRIPAGAYLEVSPYVVHRDPRYFPDPERFDPARWSPENAAARPKYCYFPFGAGGRKCIGETFALVESLLALVVIAQQWRLRLAPGHRVGLAPLVTLRPKYGMAMTFEKR